MFWGEKAGMTPLRTLFHPAEAVGPDRMLWCPMSLSICATPSPSDHQDHPCGITRAACLVPVTALEEN